MKMLFWSAILNGLLAPPLVIMVVLLTSDRKVMRNRVNSLRMKLLGWCLPEMYRPILKVNRGYSHVR